MIRVKLGKFQSFIHSWRILHPNPGPKLEAKLCPDPDPDLTQQKPSCIGFYKQLKNNPFSVQWTVLTSKPKIVLDKKSVPLQNTYLLTIELKKKRKRAILQCIVVIIFFTQLIRFFMVLEKLGFYNNIFSNVHRSQIEMSVI